MNLFRNVIFSGTRSLKHLQIQKPASPYRIFAAPAHRIYSSKSDPDCDPDLRASWTVRVPEKQAFVIERSGSYSQTLYAGTHSLIPAIDRIADVHSLEEKAIEVKTNLAQTRDLVRVWFVTGHLYVRIADPYLASYHHKPQFSIPMLAKLAKSVVSSRIRDLNLNSMTWKMPMPMLNVTNSILNEEIASLLEDESVSDYINQIAKGWGLMCSAFKLSGVSIDHETIEKLSIKADVCVRRKRNEAVLAELQSRAGVLSGLIEEEKGKGDGEGRKVIIRRAREEAASMLATLKSVSEDLEGLRTAEE